MRKDTKNRPNWLYIESDASKAFHIIYETLGRELIEENRKRIFEKYIDKYFNTWDRFSDCICADYGFSPVVFCLYAEQNNIAPSYPLRVMRNVLNLFYDSK